MPVEPVPCSPGGGGEPVEVTTCCSPSIASAPMCRADGSTVLLVVRSGCVECGEAAETPTIIGWIDASIGAFTPGPAPLDAGPCEAGCVDTVCRQLCDDADGDGEADTTYSELWCIRADGTAELVLTYRDDPSTPYTPLAPVECTYGCPESETVTLCDDTGPFLRRYTFLADTATYEDIALDGSTPHVVTGTVGVCTGDPDSCAEQTTPAATLGLCLADGTPIAVVVTRDCEGTVTRDGWLNLTTGAWTAGAPPAGTIACGDSRSITVSGTFCDVDPDSGDVLGLVLIEYQYAADGSIAAVRLVDAVTGGTYLPQGEVTTCPAGTEQPERDLIQLCDTAPDGTVTGFIRDYARDENGAITGHSDYALDGAPYTPAGTVGLCEEPCRDTSETLLCDVAALETVTVLDTTGVPDADGWTVISYTDGGCPPDNPPAGTPPFPPIWGNVIPYAGPALGIRADQQLGATPCGAWSGYDTAPVRWVVSKTFQAPEDGTAVVQAVGFRADGGARVRINGTDVGLYGQWNQPATAGSAQVPVTAGPNVVEIEVRDVGGPNWLAGRLDIVMTRTNQFFRRTVTDCVTGEVVSVTDTTLDGQPYEVTGEVGQCEPVAECCEPPPPETRLDVESEVLCIRDQDGEITGQVVVERVYDDQTGERTEQRLTDPTTGDAVTLPAGAELVVCDEPPCPVAFATECVGAVTRTEAAYDNTSLIGGVPGQCGSVQGPDGQFPCLPTSGTSYTITSWIVNGEEVIGEGSGRAFNGGPCGPGTAENPGMHLNWSQALTNLDPIGATWSAQSAPGCAWFVGSTGGTQTVYGAMTVVDEAGRQWILGPAQSCEETQFTKVYTQECDGTVSVSWLDAQGVATDAPDGDLVPCGTGCGAGGGQGLDVETLTLCDLQADGTPVPFLRHLTYGTAGQVAVVVDTALDGFAPYTPTGTVGLCQPEPEDPAPDVEVVKLCDLVDGQDPVPFLRQLTYLPGATAPIVVDTVLDGITPYTPAGTVGTCTATAEEEPCRNTSTVLLCDAAAGTETVTPTVTSTTLAGLDLGANPAYPLLAGSWASLWSGGALTFPQDPDASEGDGFQVYRAVAGRITGTVPEDCATASGELTVSVRVTNNGPNPGAGGSGVMRLYRDGAILTSTGPVTSTPVGHVQTLTATTSVTAADLTGGALTFVLALETFHGTPKSWTADQFTISSELAGCAVQFLRNVTTDCETGQVTAVTDTTLDGAPYTVTGEVGQCQAGGGACCPPPPPEPCRNTSTLLICDLPVDGAPTLTVTDTAPAPYYPYPSGVATAGAQALWDGGTLTLPDATGPQPGTTGTVRTAAATIQASRPACDAGTARVTVTVDVAQLGPDNGCAATGFVGLYNGAGEANRVALALAPNATPAGWAGTLTAEADVPAADLAAGNITVLAAFDAYDDSGTVCPPPRRTGWELSGFTATAVYDQTGCEVQFLRSVTTDCETGEVTAVTDTTLDGAPYTVTGEAGQCTPASGGSTEPCGDTEVAQLCDLTYDPQAPIPTPASDFTLTGNVVTANGGTTLWFAQANQEANGVAELTVGGLLPAVLYEFRFASAWIGAGAPDPANNNAIYLLEILDGAAVLATRTRNVSNGSNVFPGGVLTEDMPPLAFIAPATGAVTIRFTDQTTGGAVNDRDLFLMPLEVRTAVLTVTRTPFLRRFTFGCDGGLTSTQDLALDGVTPFEVQGEVGDCTGDGGTSSAVSPCDVQNVLQVCRCDDADGDGIADTDYVELLGVDCEGVLTSLGAYTADLTGPYTPVSPVDCSDEAGGADPAFGVQARRVELAAGASWSAAAFPALQSVTAIAHGGTGTITAADGASTLHTGEAATWSVARDADAALTGPLTITADSGTVTITWTQGVTL